jgi:CRP-like cAMP-binding protein
MDYTPNDSPLYRLFAQGRHYVVARGQVVSAFQDDTLLYLIKSGNIKRYRITSDGEKNIQVLYGPGDILPLTPVYKAIFSMDMYSGPETYYYEAMTKLEYYVINHAKLLAALETGPIMYKDLFYTAGLRLDSYIHRLESLSLKSANRKIAHQLIYMASAFGMPTADGPEIGLPLTHHDLGDMLGMARETVTRAIADLTERGMLVPGRSIVIADLARLKVEAQWLE